MVSPSKSHFFTSIVCSLHYNFLFIYYRVRILCQTRKTCILNSSCINPYFKCRIVSDPSVVFFPSENSNIINSFKLSLHRIVFENFHWYPTANSSTLNKGEELIYTPIDTSLYFLVRYLIKLTFTLSY